jgi:predicted ABC-type ATPase
VADRRGRIFVAAGTNGAGKSAIVGEFLANAGAEYFNPDAFARNLIDAGYSQLEANSVAWQFGFDALRRAIDRNESFAFETTLAGNSIIRELQRAIDVGLEVCIWYVGLSSPERHISRVKARVSRGGHDISAEIIRRRYPRSLANLVSLIGRAAEVHVFDNDQETPSGLPAAKPVFRMNGTRIVQPDVATLLEQTPEWAKPLAAAALKCSARRTGSGRKKK